MTIHLKSSLYIFTVILIVVIVTTVNKSSAAVYVPRSIFKCLSQRLQVVAVTSSAHKHHSPLAEVMTHTHVDIQKYTCLIFK